MSEMLMKVTVNDETKEYRRGTTFLEISEEHKAEYENDIILVYVNGKLRELFKTVQEDCTIRFVTTAENEGYKTYTRGMILLMLRAFNEVCGEEKTCKIVVEHSLGDGLYCEAIGVKITDKMLEQVKTVMQRMCSHNIPFHKRSIGTTEAIQLFHNNKMYDKEKLFRFRRVSKTNIYDLDGYDDYFYGYMPAETGILSVFDLFIYDEGFILLLPSQNNPQKLRNFEPRTNLFHTLQNSNRWGITMGLETVGALNEEISKGNIQDIMLVQEAFTEKRIADIAVQIQERPGVKFVMIAGPSSSGKTTFSHRLSIQLRTLGFKPHPIGVDDYFVNREDTPKDEDGNYNFETLGAIDVKQFNEDMTDLLDGKTVELPSFNFKSGKREYKGNFKTLGADDILVIEGIHGLNDKLSYSLPKESKFKIYISALTQINVDEHNRIPTTDGRLIRRMVRDARTRGTQAEQTIAMWPSVRRGEEENIFPFQEKADCMFNSALLYELPVLKQYAEPLLFGISEDSPQYPEAKRLLKFLDYILGVSSEGVPNNSILREFIGGSYFKV